jgi:hypothetical protein
MKQLPAGSKSGGFLQTGKRLRSEGLAHAHASFRRTWFGACLRLGLRLDGVVAGAFALPGDEAGTRIDLLQK